MRQRPHFQNKDYNLRLPNFITPTKRGAPPHLTPDQPVQPEICCVYLEDIWDQKGPVTSLYDISKLPINSPVVIGSVRHHQPKLIKNKPNTDSQIAIDTFQGSQLTTIDEVNEFNSKFNFPVVFAPYDLPSQSCGPKIGNNRLVKMTTRSKNWLTQIRNHTTNNNSNEQMQQQVFAEIPHELNNPAYLNSIESECDGYILPPLANFENLNSKKIRVLNIDPGIEQLTEYLDNYDLIPLDVSKYSDKGVLIMSNLETIDLNDDKYKVDKTVIKVQNHTYAYIHHLLKAEEMTAQVLLQMHNLKTVQEYFQKYQS